MKKNIAVIFGGCSVEHDISIVTALSAVIRPLEASGKYTIVPIYIDKKGCWFSDDKLKDITLYSSGRIQEFISKEKPVSLLFEGGLQLLKAGIKTKRIKIDVAFPAMHGSYGEDGSLMGLLRMANVPFVGCDMDASVIAMDKAYAKQIANAHDIKTPHSVIFDKHSYLQNKPMYIEDIKRELVFPVFVKPAHLGSSIGITKVKVLSELEDAIEVALHYDDKVVVENGVENLIEVTVPIIGNQAPIPSLVEQPLLSSEDFFDFDAKYVGNGKKGGGKKGAQGYSNLPAKISKELYDMSVDTALRMYRAVGCKGIARIDLLIDGKQGVVYFNEINPLPGDLYAHNWRASGISGVELVSRLIDFAEESFAQKNTIEQSFSTNYLQQF